MKESRLVMQKDGTEKYVEGYFLTIDQLSKLVREFQVDCYDGYISNDKSYIESWIEKDYKK
jgi:hypothetical protein